MKKLILILTFVLAASTGQAARHTFNSKLVNETGLAYSNTYTLDTSNLALDTLAASAVYSTTTFSSASFIDGTQSTATITVVSTAALVGVAASDTISIVSNTLPTGAIITFTGAGNKFNGVYQLINGGDWTTQDTSSNTAISIMNAFNNHSAYLNVTASTPTTTSVKIQSNGVGLIDNAYKLSVNTTSMTVATPTFTGGQHQATLCINGTCLTQGTDYTSGTSVTATAKSIAGAINASATLSAIIVSTNIAGVVYATSTAVGAGTNYSIVSSTTAAMTPSGPAFTGGTASAVNTSNSSLFLTKHGFTRALPVLFTKSSGTPPGILATGTTYYVIPLDANDIQLASTSANAVAGTPVVGITTQTVAGAGSFTLAPLTYSGTTSWKWQVSGDNVNWNDLTTNPNNVAVSSTTFASPFTATSVSYDLGPANYQYYRLNVVGPAQGGLKLAVTMTGRQSNPYRP